MKPVPGWFTSLCWVVAITASLAVGLQYDLSGSFSWAALYVGVAVATALLPTRRLVAAGATLIGVVAGIWAAWELHRGAGLESSLMTTARGPLPLALTSGWLLLASVLRALWA